MKVALVVPGGVDRSGTHRVIPALLWLLERLARRHEVHVFALRQEPRPGRWPLLGAQVHNVGGRAPQLRTVGAILREHRRGAFHVLHGVWAGAGAAAAVAGRLVRRPVLLHLAGGELADVPEVRYGGWRSRRGRATVRLAARGAARVVVPSEPMRARAAELGIAAERLAWGVSLEDWPPLAPARRRDPRAPARLVHVASLNRVKDPWTLVRAAALLRARGVVFQLDVAGVDTLGGEIQRLAVELGIEDAVRFHGFLPHARLRALVAEADALLLTSRHESACLAVLEAAVSGVPTVGTRVGHLAEWAPEAAVVVPPGDPAALADAVAALLGDEERRLCVALDAQSRALEEHADHTAARVLQIYDELTR